MAAQHRRDAPYLVTEAGVNAAYKLVRAMQSPSIESDRLKLEASKFLIRSGCVTTIQSLGVGGAVVAGKIWDVIEAKRGGNNFPFSDGPSGARHEPPLPAHGFTRARPERQADQLQFQTGLIGVRVQQGPKLPPL